MKTREEFFEAAVIAAMQGLLAASGHYRDELMKNPCEYVANAARQYADELTEQLYGPELPIIKERLF
ncbi:MAG: hypothetical protein EBR30_14780 [Cytophagia bacterium]|jgi:hypothetical protein|nr:hypothetical protein [Cytophagia bacterium]